MSEGPPQKQPVKIESKEGAERPPKYRTIMDEVLEVHEDGSKTHRVLECNGHIHRRCVDRISYDEKGQVTFVDELSREEEGPCDGNHS
jgi:hypothetical protein